MAFIGYKRQHPALSSQSERGFKALNVNWRNVVMRHKRKNSIPPARIIQYPSRCSQVKIYIFIMWIKLLSSRISWSYAYRCILNMALQGHSTSIGSVCETRYRRGERSSSVKIIVQLLQQCSPICFKCDKITT